jgi:hypothetical protein
MRSLFLVVLVAVFNIVKAQVVFSGPQFKESELIEPELLASKITNSQNILIFNVGPAGEIKNSIKIGPSSEQANLDKLKSSLKDVEKDQEIVFYCGCCPFSKCPNIMPALEYLKASGYKNFKLLNIQQNLKTNWINMSYPMKN